MCGRSGKFGAALGRKQLLPCNGRTAIPRQTSITRQLDTTDLKHNCLCCKGENFGCVRLEDFDSLKTHSIYPKHYNLRCDVITLLVQVINAGIMNKEDLADCNIAGK